MRQEIINLYDDYTHARLDRRSFMDQLSVIAGGSAAAAALLPLLKANQAQAALIAPDDARLAGERISFAGATGEISAYLVRPAAAGGPLPGVVVIHENRGLNAHIEDVTRRMALAGFLAMAPDFLSPAGGTPQDEDQARELIGKLDPAQTVANAKAALEALRGQSGSNGKVGAVGFCWGGGLVNQIAAAVPELGAGVAYYGRQPDAAAAAAIKAPLMLHYAGLDERINAGIPAYEEALKAAGANYQLFMYEGVNHAFNNDTSAARYDEAAASLAWDRTIDFFKQHLAA